MNARLLIAGIALIGTAATSPAHAQQVDPIRQDWKVTRASCPVGCSRETAAFLKRQRGTIVRIAPGELRASFLDTCARTETELKPIAVKAILAELNGIAPKPVFTRKKLPIAGSMATGGYVYCLADGNRSPALRVLSYRPDEMVVLFEERSLLILR